MAFCHNGLILSGATKTRLDQRIHSTKEDKMSQLIACKTAQGIVVGADSKAVDIDDNGNLIELKVDRLHKLSQFTVVLNGGAVAGEAMCQALRNFIVEENLVYVDEIHQAALPFMATEFDRFMRKNCEIQPLNPIHQVNFILGGYTPRDEKNPFQLYLLWTKRKLPLLDSDEIGAAFSVPRIIKLEHRLHQLATQSAGIHTVVSEVRKGLEKQVETNEEVSEPLHFAAINEDGIQSI
jgi:hypothetical protein